MTTRTKKRAPGEFRARCNLRREVPWDQMTGQLWTLANERDYTREFRDVASLRVDRETGRHGRWVVVFAACEGFETTDAAAFERHMAEAHGRKPSGPRQLRLGAGHWRGPRLTKEGTALPPAAAAQVQTCDGCGLIAEMGDSAAADRWWREHLEHCVERERGAA